MAKKITISDIDRLIESELTNVQGLQNDKQSFDLSSFMDKNINMPVYDYLKNSEKEEQEKIKFKNKLRSIDTDPNRRKSTDLDIAHSKEKLNNIIKLRAQLKAKEQELKIAQQAQQNKMKTSMDKNQSQDSSNQSQKSSSNSNSVIRQTISTNIRETFGIEDTKRFDSLPIITRAGTSPEETIKEIAPQLPLPAAAPAPMMQPKKKPVLKVNFDSKTPNPYQVEFTERGFLIGSTRLSFEVIETALSKNFTITLDNGNGLVLDAIKMQKILKYKDKV